MIYEPQGPLGSLPTYLPPVKSKVFVSYHHHGDQNHYDRFSRFISDDYDVLYDNSPERAIGSGDPEYIMRRLREDFITGSSCTIVLCGAVTSYRKFVDWEIACTLDKEHGLIGIELPTRIIDLGNVIVPSRLHDNIVSRYALWTSWNEVFQKGAHFVQKLVEQAKDRSKRLSALIKNDRVRMPENEPPPWERNPRTYL